MNSPDPDLVGPILAGERLSHRSTALRHALRHRRPGVWSDQADAVSSVVWLRPGDAGTFDAFAAGEPGPALDWIEANVGGSTVALLAPPSWEPEVRDRGGRISTGTVVMFRDYNLLMAPKFSPEARVLTMNQAETFDAITPAWALRSWGGMGPLVERGLALGLLSAEQFVSMAWTYESLPDHDKIGVATLPKFQGLGLGKRVAGALIDRILRDRDRAPLWVTSLENTASMALARSLGFENPVGETLLRWTPGGD